MKVELSEAVAWRCSIKKGVLKKFTKFTGKQLCRGLFLNKIAAFKPATLLKKRLRHRCFPLDFAKFLGTSFYRTPPLAASKLKNLEL